MTASNNAILSAIILCFCTRKGTKLEFDILDTIDPREIHTASLPLSRVHVREISLNVREVIHTLSPKQFLFLLTCLSKYGTNFDNNLRLINEYLKTLDDDNVKMKLENVLYNNFLKKYENENSFNSFFKTFSKFYSRIVQPEASNNNSIFFFVHSPNFLAHTNALFQLLAHRKDTSMEVKIASLSHNSKFEDKCESLNVKFIPLNGRTFVEKYQSLIDQSKFSLALCWNGPPIHLDYISKISNNTIWWTHRMHPSIEYVKLRLSGASYDRQDTFHRFDKKWNYFDPMFTINNWNSNLNWEIRKFNFGTFCREELINTSEHWENVKTILANNENTVYNYCGRSAIHGKWCFELDIDANRVKFLGWLNNPEKEILKMAFLLDGITMGQGLMGMEALAGKIPIIQYEDTPGFYNTFLRQVKFQKVDHSELQEMYGTVFCNQVKLRSISKSLFNSEFNSKIANLLHKKYAQRVAEHGTFSQFVNLIKEN